MDFENITRDFAKTVFGRIKGSIGLTLDPNTIESYAGRIMTLKKQGLLPYISDPDKLHNKLRGKFSNPVTILTAFRPAASFASNLTEAERAWFQNFDPHNTAQRYRAHMTVLNRETKERRLNRVQESQN